MMPVDIACCRTTDALVAQLAAGRDLTATWLVVDMDAFFASVEELHDPFLVRFLQTCASRFHGQLRFIHCRCFKSWIMTPSRQMIMCCMQFPSTVHAVKVL